MSVAKIAHLTSVHPRYDTRIFIKQCSGLAASGYEVSLVVADGKGDEQKNGIAILDVGKPSGRLDRVIRASRRVFNKAVEIDAEIYHLHDPELIPIGLRLRKMGKIVVFDAHEDVPKQLLVKPYLGPVRRRVFAYLFSRYERYACSRLSGVITATPSIGDKFLTINAQTTVINNFPLLDELHADVSWSERKNKVCYVGVISEIRGIREIVQSLSEVKSSAELMLAGTFAEANVESDVKAMPGWKRASALGFVDRSHMQRLLGQSVAGLVTFYPLPNHIDAQPNKMFEYMSAGIPVIASNFPLWREIIEGNNCGLCVDPMDSTAIAAAIDELVTDRDKAKILGENGRKAVLSQYNWPAEEKKLLSLYSSLLRNSDK